MSSRQRNRHRHVIQGSTHFDVGVAHRNLAVTLLDHGHATEAQKHILKALAIHKVVPAVLARLLDSKQLQETKRSKGTAEANTQLALVQVAVMCAVLDHNTAGSQYIR